MPLEDIDSLKTTTSGVRESTVGVPFGETRSTVGTAELSHSLLAGTVAAAVPSAPLGASPKQFPPKTQAGLSQPGSQSAAPARREPRARRRSRCMRGMVQEEASRQARLARAGQGRATWPVLPRVTLPSRAGIWPRLRHGPARIPRPVLRAMPRPLLLPIAAGACALLANACQSPSARNREAEERARELLARWFPEAKQPVDRASLLSALVPETAPQVPAGTPLEEDLRSAAQSALARTDFQQARDLLVEWLGPRELDLAERVLEGGDPARALAMLDRCARSNPESPRLYSLRARARYLVGIQQGPEGRELVQSALDDGLRSARSRGGPEDWTQASEAAFWLGQTGPAREYSEQAVERGAALADGAAERARAQASVAELRELEAAGAAPDALAAPAQRTARALEEFLGFAPADLWAWQQLTGILEQHERAGRAAAATARALEFAPADPLLHERAARLALALGGRERLLSDYADFSARHPEVALGAWYPAVQHYEAGCELAAVQRDGRTEFEAADALFARAAALEPSIAPACQDYRAACRVGIGWSLLERDVQASEAAFHQAETLAPGRALPAGLPSPLEGLDRLARHWADKDLLHASELFGELHRLAPENAGWANDAGLALRDSAVELESRARAACARGARGEADALLARAREQMERSFRAYQDAVQLAPDDVALLNDCALILVYHLQRDPDEAERMLRRALELGEARLPELARALAEAGLEDESKNQRKLEQQRLLSAMGDAWQNLGVLCLSLRGDAAHALEYLEKCRGLDPRQDVTGPGGYLEQAQAALSGKLDPRVTDATRWAAPCKDK